MRRAITTTIAALLAAVAVPAVASASDAATIRAEVGSDALAASGYSGKGVTVAVIDSGIANTSELGPSILTRGNFAGVASGDLYGHGTFVAGLVHRTAPAANLVSIKLSGADGAVDATQVLAAIQWCVANRNSYGIRVINLSFGTDSTQSYTESPLNYAVERAWDAGIVVVTSAGNLGGQVTKPGDDPLAITVGAVDDAGTADTADDTIPGFSSHGPTQDGLTKPDVYAPGVHVESARAPGSTVESLYPDALVGDTDMRGSGTSFSTGIVSGLVAQLLSANPKLTPDQVKYALMSGATPLAGSDGGGIANGPAALAAGLGTPESASAPRSNGQGSLDDMRGSFRVKLTDGTMITGDMTTQGHMFNRGDYMASQWGASQWGASQWGASQWGASQWGASQWGASQWGASQWWASQWG
jgi:serine protease AprX